jgi:hypothetical protein
MYNNTMFSAMFQHWMFLSDFKVGQPTKDCIRAYHRQFMSDFELWLDDNEDDLRIECSENGCDYEADFDMEQYLEDTYFLSIGE